MELREPFLDIIAIGAVNYDCIFFCDKVRRIADAASTAEVGEVEERFNYTREDICRQIELLMNESEYRISVGGSSFNSLRTAREIDKKIKLGFVGVCGTPSPTEVALGFDPDPTTSFTFLDNQDWLFFDKEAPGLSCVQVMKADGNRGDIAIVPGANDLLKQRITEREKECGAPFPGTFHGPNGSISHRWPTLTHSSSSWNTSRRQNSLIPCCRSALTRVSFTRGNTSRSFGR